MINDKMELLTRFLRSIEGPAHTCTVCSGTVWAFAGLKQLDRDKVTAHLQVGFDIFPVAVIVCERCYKIESFAWMPIEEWGKENAKV